MPVETGEIIYLVIVLVMVTSSLLARRLSVSYLVRNILIWILIFLGIFGIFSFKDRFLTLGRSAYESVGNGPTQTGDGRIILRKAPDGHFWAPVKINGVDLHFMVDSGATTTALSTQDARKAGLDLNAIGFPVVVNTANGIAEMRRARVDRLQLGTLTRRDFPVLVSDHLGDTNLLGMNFLSSLRRWEISGDRLILTL